MSTTASLDRCSCGSPTQSRDHLKMKQQQQQQQQQQPQQQHSNDTSGSINHDIIKENAIKDQQTTRNVAAVVQMNNNCSNDKFINLKDNGISDTKEFIDSKNASTVATMTTTSKTERNLMTSRRRSTLNVYKKMSASKSSPVRNNKESEKSIPGVNNEKINDEQINDENMQASNENERSLMESDPSSSRNYCKNETANKTEKDLDYTALSYDVNYVKVSPPRLTRRPKKSDDGNDVGNKPDVKLESSFVKRDKSQPKRLQKAPAKSPEKEIAGEDENEIVAKNSTSTKENDSQNVLELTFTVVLDKETLKNVRRNINLSESDESDDKNRTEEVQLDETSQRIVAETITEVLAKTGQLGNVINSNALNSSMNLASVNNDKNDCTLTKSMNVINEPNFDKYKLNEKIHQASEGTKNISSLKNVQPFDVKLTDKTQNAEVAQKETTQLTYQTLERQLPTRTSSNQTQHQNASQRQFKSLDETYNSKKYQTLSNFSPKQNRIVTKAQVHASFDAECLPSKNKNDPHYFHGRFVSNICDYGKENHLSVKNHKKYPTNGYFQEWSGHSINNIAVEDEQTHMNWDDLMKEAKSLGIPLKRPGGNEEKPKRSSNSFSNRLLSSFGTNAGNRKSDMNMAKSVCGGELGRSVYFDDYDYRTSSVVYHCSYGPKKSSPSKEKLRLVDFLFGRNRNTKSFDEDCPLCKKQSSSQYGHHSCSGHNYSKTASSKKSAFSNLHKQSKYRCTKNSCPECVCTCFDAYHKTGATRSSSSPPPASTLKIKHKDGNNNNYYEGKLKECYNSQHVGQVGIVGKVSAPCKSDSCCQEYWANNNHNHNYNTNNSISYNINNNFVDAYNQLDAGYRLVIVTELNIYNRVE
ncbi:hypothetical protein HELRODRAFT_193167 [Helobdella robusta]|uniref:Uncharacterized protein n=1 Tax=Helobdella robusta TaxID=6412 RepID=T1FUP4_HELRO|nr:hypothetical protein HELRODRAFT_193167 [Helobdella robusta]ESN97638.1 hypothetical protein HELRODRAFT_193167 [Helobdella robusta]